MKICNTNAGGMLNEIDELKEGTGVSIQCKSNWIFQGISLDEENYIVEINLIEDVKIAMSDVHSSAELQKTEKRKQI